MSAAGKVCTGFSLPYIAEYECNDGVISYSNGRKLARGVSVELSLDESDSDAFRADNQDAETEAGKFTSGTVNLTVDGLFADAEAQIQGLPTATDGWYDYDDRQNKPYLGIGYIARYQSEGVESFEPTILVKTSFNQIGKSHQTGEKTKNYQTQALSARILRGDDEYHTWKKIAEEDYATEAEAEAAIKEVFNISSSSGGGGASGGGG